MDFLWNELKERLFQELRKRLTPAPLLRHPSSDKIFVLTTDASKYAVGAALEQRGQPVTYLSRRLVETETWRDTGDQEILAVMIAIREWEVHLKDCPFIIRTDHEPIKYLQTKPRLSRRQTRWLDELQSYTVQVEHIKGVYNGAADALSRLYDIQPTIKGLHLSHNDFHTAIRECYESGN